MRRLTIKVRPGAKQSRLEAVDETTWCAHVKAPPVDGKANEALIELVAAHFGVRRRAVTLVSGHSARIKRIEIAED